MTIVIIIVVIIVVAVLLGLTLRNREADDGVDTFRRQIDALSPEARKPTVDRVKSAERSDPDEADDDGPGEAGRDGRDGPDTP